MSNISYRAYGYGSNKNYETSKSGKHIHLGSQNKYVLQHFNERIPLFNPQDGTNKLEKWQVQHI